MGLGGRIRDWHNNTNGTEDDGTDAGSWRLERRSHRGGTRAAAERDRAATTCAATARASAQIASCVLAVSAELPGSCPTAAPALAQEPRCLARGTGVGGWGTLTAKCVCGAGASAATRQHPFAGVVCCRHDMRPVCLYAVYAIHVVQRQPGCLLAFVILRTAYRCIVYAVVCSWVAGFRSH